MQGVSSSPSNTRMNDADLRLSHERLSLAIRAAGLLVWEYDPNLDRVYCSDNAADILGISVEAANSGAGAWHAHILPEDRDAHEARLSEAIARGDSFISQFRWRRPDNNRIIWLEAKGEVRRDNNGRPQLVVGILMDVTARCETEEALRTSEARFRQIVASNMLGILFWGTEGQVYDANEAFLTMLGYSLEDLRQQRIDWQAITPPEYRDRDRKILQDLQAKRMVAPFEKQYLHHNGKRIDVLIGAAMMPGRDNDGVAFVLDITERKNAERTLRQINSELEEFAFVASHDLQEPLRKVSIYTQLMLAEMSEEPNPEVVEYAEFVRDGVRRMQTLIQDLLLYSRIIHYSPELDSPCADLNVALTEAIDVLDQSIAATGAIITTTALPCVRGDQRQISQVFQNLLSNALKYVDPGRTPRIHIEAQRREAAWEIQVIDNGIGFGSDYQEKIFGLFKRLYKDEYPGTGLGLAICKRIIERYQGRIWANSDGESLGARFCFSLPAVEG